jgi:AcrR family transcriptional regulator
LKGEALNVVRQPLTRTLIFETGIAIADAEGIDAITMRRVAATLNVQAMSLYNHVSNKRDLLDGMAAHLLATLAVPDIAAMSWRELAGRVGRAYRQLGLDHPALYPYVLERPFGSPESLATLDAFLNVFREAGFSPTGNYLAFSLFTGFVEGFTLDEITRRNQRSLRDPVKNPLLSEDVPANYQAAYEVFALGAIPDGDAFDRCLELVLDAMEALMAPEHPE